MSRVWPPYALALAFAALGGCTDARPRPAPPTVELTLDTTQAIHSPGQVIGSVYIHDDHGIDTVYVAIHSADERLIADSVVGVSDFFEVTRPIHWLVPSGLAPGTGIQVVVRVVSFVGFVAADTAFGRVEAALHQHR
ncbi:MAG: hypothetical protein AAB409_08165 [Gemmatimonadota bacterium]